MLKNVNGFSMGDVYETTAKGEQGRLIAASWLITMGNSSTFPYIIFLLILLDNFYLVHNT